MSVTYILGLSVTYLPAAHSIQDFAHHFGTPDSAYFCVIVDAT